MNSMKRLNKKQLLYIDGGFSISGTIINAFTSGIKTVLEVGRSLGTALRRVKEDKMCAI